MREEGAGARGGALAATNVKWLSLAVSHFCIAEGLPAAGFGDSSTDWVAVVADLENLLASDGFRPEAAGESLSNPREYVHRKRSPQGHLSCKNACVSRPKLVFHSENSRCIAFAARRRPFSVFL